MGPWLALMSSSAMRRAPECSLLGIGVNPTLGPAGKGGDSVANGSRSPDRVAPVVVVCRKLPAPIRGGLDLRLHALIQALAAHRPVYVVGLHGSPQDQDPVATYDLVPGAAVPQIDAAQVLRSTLDGDLARHFASASGRLASRVAEVVRETGADTVILSRLEMAGLGYALADESRARVILDLDEAEGPLAASMADLAEGHGHRLLLKRYARELTQVEAVTLFSFPGAIWVSTAIEADNVRLVNAEADVRVVPNCLDVDSYSRPALAHSERMSWLFPARFDYLPNQDAARQLLDALPRPGFRETLVLAGSRMPDWLRGIDLPGVAVVDTPVDVRPLLWEATALIAPLRSGGGSRMKILEAMAARTPVIATQVGAGGLNARVDEHFFPWEEGVALAEVIDGLVNDPGRSCEVADAAHSWVASRHSLAVLRELLADLLVA